MNTHLQLILFGPSLSFAQVSRTIYCVATAS